MYQPYKYYLRPAYGSDELLLEFSINSDVQEFFKDLFKTLESIDPKIESLDDLWMNDEVLLHVDSIQGRFLLSKDVWGFAFIMAEKNQSCIKFINDILVKSSLFEKVEVDFENYKISKK